MGGMFRELERELAEHGDPDRLFKPWHPDDPRAPWNRDKQETQKERVKP